MATPNVEGAGIEPSADAPKGLQDIYNALVLKAEAAMTWYESRQRAKKRGARFVRSAAILLGALTAIIPSIIAMIPDRISMFGLTDFPVVRLNPIATITGVVAATAILFDRLLRFLFELGPVRHRPTRKFSTTSTTSVSGGASRSSSLTITCRRQTSRSSRYTTSSAPSLSPSTIRSGTKHRAGSASSKARSGTSTRRSKPRRQQPLPRPRLPRLRARSASRWATSHRSKTHNGPCTRQPQGGDQDWAVNSVDPAAGSRNLQTPGRRAARR